MPVVKGFNCATLRDEVRNVGGVLPGRTDTVSDATYGFANTHSDTRSILTHEELFRVAIGDTVYLPRRRARV